MVWPLQVVDRHKPFKLADATWCSMSMPTGEVVFHLSAWPNASYETAYVAAASASLRVEEIGVAPFEPDLIAPVYSLESPTRSGLFRKLGRVESFDARVFRRQLDLMSKLTGYVDFSDGELKADASGWLAVALEGGWQAVERKVAGHLGFDLLEFVKSDGEKPGIDEEWVGAYRRGNWSCHTVEEFKAVMDLAAQAGVIERIDWDDVRNQKMKWVR